MSDGDWLVPLDPIDDSDLRTIDALLSAAGKPWRQMPMPAESAQQFLASLAARGHAAESDAIPPARISMPIITHTSGDRFMMRPSRITAFLAVALTVCLIAASAGTFVALNHRHTNGPFGNKISPTPAQQGPLAMPANIFDLAMVSDHEGWAMQMVPKSLDQNLLHFRNGTWQATTLPGLGPSYSGTLAMATASDGWLIATTQDPTTQNIRQFLYHYDGTAWKQVALPTLHGTGRPVLSTISLGANGDDWMAGEYINNGSKMLSEQRLAPDGALSCLPDCGKALLLHLVGGRWTEVTVPAGITITAESVSMGWFIGNASDPTALYHYQNGSWSRVPLGITASPATIAMLSPTDGWIEAVDNQQTTEPFADTWIIYHFNGTAVQRIASMIYRHCFGTEQPSLSVSPPADVWAPLMSDTACFSMQQLWHIQGETTTTVTLPAPYSISGVPRRDAAGNPWLLATRLDMTTPSAVGPISPDFAHEAILRWNGNQWVIFAQTQG